MKSYAFYLLCLSTAASLPAATWVVDNDTTRPANFRSAQEAHDAAAAGDTLLFVGSGITYGILNMSKQLHLVGPGYNFVENGIPSANNGEAVFQTVSLNTGTIPTNGGGASGSSLSGLRPNTVDVVGGVTNAVLDKCFIFSISGQLQEVGTGYHYVSGLIVKRCFFEYIQIQGGAALIQNSRGFQLHASTVPLQSGSGKKGATLEVQNSIFSGFGIYNASGFTNIDLPSTMQCTNCIVNGHIAPASGLGITGSVLFQNAAAFPGNRATSSATAYGEVYTTVSAPAKEAHYRLNPDPSNPAIGAGIGGVDAGMFAGAQPYQLSGIPARPRVTHLSTSGVISDTVGLSVQAGGEVRP